MTTNVESLDDLERMLTTSGLELTPVENDIDVGDLKTEDGTFKVSKPQTTRQERMVTLYRTDTGEAVPSPVNEVPKRLKKTYPDIQQMRDSHPELIGKRAFTLGRRGPDGNVIPPEPLIKDSAKKYLCMLHPDAPEFEYTRSLGIRSTCRRHNIPTLIDMEEHVKSKHAGAWPLIERDRERREKDEDRQRQNNLMEMLARSQGVEIPAHLKPAVPQAEPAPEPKDEDLLPYPPAQDEDISVLGAETATVEQMQEAILASGETAQAHVTVNAGTDLTETLTQEARAEGLQAVSEGMIRTFTKACPKCDFVAEGATEGSASGKLGQHKRHAHPKNKR